MNGRVSYSEANKSEIQIDSNVMEVTEDTFDEEVLNSDKKVFATMTFDKSGRTLTGSTPEIVINTLEGLGVDALGVNCSLGPKELYSIIYRR